MIKIDMGADIRAQGGAPSPNDILTLEVTPNPNNTIDSTPPQELPPPRRGPGRPPGSRNKPKVDAKLLPIIAANKQEGGSDGEPL